MMYEKSLPVGIALKIEISFSETMLVQLDLRVITLMQYY